MEKCKNAAGGSRCLKECLPTPSSHRGEAGDTGETVQDLRDDVDSWEEGMSQIGASPKTPSGLHNQVNCPLSNLYCLSIDRMTLYLRTGCIIASM